MATIKLQGNTSGSGSIILTAPNTNSTRTITLPDQDMALGGAGSLEAWVNFKGTGTISIFDSGNVSSLTDIATGRYNTNFSSALASANYATSFDNTSYHPNNVSVNSSLEGGPNLGTVVALKTTSTVRQTVGTNGGNFDTAQCSVLVAL